jgi:hypothetical protein
MVRLGRTKREDRSRAAKYAAVGRSLLHTARDLELMGEAKYGNGVAIIAIHSAIAYSDALTVAYREIKSTDGDHVHAADVLVRALGLAADTRQVQRLRAILNAKSHASYSGNFYTLRDGQEILKELEQYVSWAEQKLMERSPS